MCTLLQFTEEKIEVSKLNQNFKYFDEENAFDVYNKRVNSKLMHHPEYLYSIL